MSKIIESWMAKHNEEHGHYSHWAGFEEELRAHDDLLDQAYTDMNVHTQIQLMTFVCGLLEREAKLQRGG